MTLQNSLFLQSSYEGAYKGKVILLNLKAPEYKDMGYREIILYSWNSIPNFIIWGWDLMTVNLDTHDSRMHFLHLRGSLDFLFCSIVLATTAQESKIS